MSLNCLQIIQTASKRLGLTPPAVAVQSSDNAILQLVALLEEEGQEQATRYPWQSLQNEAQFTTVATELQGTMETIASGWDYVVNDTMWNRSLRRPVYGPKSQQDWQQVKAMQLNGPFNSFRIKGDSLYFYPAPVAGQTVDFEYQTSNWVNLNAGGTGSTWASDLDTPALDDQLMTLGLIWRWRQAKGLDFSADYQKYEKRYADMANRDASKPRLYMDGSTYDIQPVILVPRGSFGI